MALLKKIAHLLRCVACRGDLIYSENAYLCARCGSSYPVVDGVPRFVTERLWGMGSAEKTLREKTSKYFGFEWDYFRDWGFLEDAALTEDERRLFYGGYVSSRKTSFDEKCRMSAEDLDAGKITLDAGCGNGRYTFEAAVRGDGTVIGIDLGHGSVVSAHEHTKKLGNVIILQADIFNLPIKDSVIDSCFSNGVLMHTGDARKAFESVSRTIKEDGIFVAHVYNTLNPIWEFNDFMIRSVTTRLGISANMLLAKGMAKAARQLNKHPRALELANYFLRLQGHPILMFDWYAAPVATHHTYQELAVWYRENGFELLDEVPARKLFKHPWGINLKGRKKASHMKS